MNLDEEQRAIVESKEKNIVVVAGAGSGKTRVLTERIKFLLDEGVEPSNIVAITFTNLAAEEMKERLREVNGIGDVFIGTIHSFANRIYKASGKDYQLLTDDVKIDIYKEVLSQPQYKALKFNRFMKYLDLQKLVDVGKKSEDVLINFLLPSEMKVLQKCEKDVYRYAARNNIITFEQLIVHATEYFKTTGSFVDYLFVDEFQDICTSEYKFIRSLNANNFFFVGDDFQAIYGFKGGNVYLFMELIMGDEFTTYYLSKNYRNPIGVVEVGQKVIDQVSEKVNKTIQVVKPFQGTVQVYSRENEKQLIRLLKNDENNLKDWFILARTNKEIFHITSLLEMEWLPHVAVRKGNYSLEQLRKVMEEDKVKIMTVHAAKGLESKKVILYGDFPIKQRPYLLNEEERRVMYVGITRAEQELYIFN